MAIKGLSLSFSLCFGAGLTALCNLLQSSDLIAARSEFLTIIGSFDMAEITSWVAGRYSRPLQGSCGPHQAWGYQANNQGRLIMNSISSRLKAVSGAVLTVLKSFLFLFKISWRAVFTLLFIGSLSINVSMFTWSAGALALSTAFSAVTGISTVATDLVDSKAKLAASQKQVGELKQKIAKTKKQVGGLTKKIGTRTGRSVVRSVASISAEAIPAAGVVTIIAVTGLEIAITGSEIYDACATMKDLRELNHFLDTGEDIDTGTVCGLGVPDPETVIEKVKKSPKAAYESARSVDVPLPSWSDVTAIIKRGWDGSLNSLKDIWDWLFGG